MGNNENWEYFLDELLSSAIKNYKQTREYALLQEKQDQMDKDCITHLTKDDHRFAEECFALLMDMSGAQEKHVYRQGLLDCVRILKKLQVLA